MLLTPQRLAASADSMLMLKLLQRASLSVLCFMPVALAAACGDSGSGEQSQTASQAGSAAAAATPPMASGTAGKPAAVSGSGASAGTGAQRPNNPQPSGSGTSAAAAAGQQAAPLAGSGAAAASGGSASTAGTSATGGVAAAGGVVAGSAGSAGTPASATADCDRKCLLDIMQKYLDAVIAHDPTKVPLSPSLKMTDNGVTAKPGDGLWKTATMMVADARLDYADPTTKNVGSQCLINEGSAPAMYEVRLKVEGGLITEIESMTVRRQGAANGFFSPNNLKPEAVFLKMPEASERMTRDQLESITLLYLDYLEGKKSGRDVPFDQGCKRYENGVATASGLSSFNSQSWSFEVTRRILIIDEEAQITWGMFPFTQSANTLVVGEAFKMLGGKIMMIQAVMANMPAKAWE